MVEDGCACHCQTVAGRMDDFVQVQVKLCGSLRACAARCPEQKGECAGVKIGTDRCFNARQTSGCGADQNARERASFDIERRPWIDGGP